MNVNEAVFDVCVVGSGAAGGTLSSRLARQGLNVIVVEGGPRIDPTRAFNTHAMPCDFPNRKVPVMVPGVAGFEDERTRGVGGKTLLWNAVAWRLSQRDFKGHSFEGAGVDWPLDSSDLAPYYDGISRSEPDVTRTGDDLLDPVIFRAREVLGRGLALQEFHGEKRLPVANKTANRSRR
jgi:choline dehydrogenase-like flavoprotein